MKRQLTFRWPVFVLCASAFFVAALDVGQTSDLPKTLSASMATSSAPANDGVNCDLNCQDQNPVIALELAAEGWND